jgi:hypothetical protein
MTSQATFEQRLANYLAGSWFDVYSVDELTQFYQSRLPLIRVVSQELGYAIMVHGSLRRDLDLVAVPWTENANPDINALAHAIAYAACGLTREGDYQWEVKPHKRRATSIPICWPHWAGCHDIPGIGHIDLSVLPVG